LNWSLAGRIKIPCNGQFLFLDWGTNGYATGFVVGEGLAMTAYHVVSGELSDSKKAALGFSHRDQLEVKYSSTAVRLR